jgi:hypothetical protein
MRVRKARLSPVLLAILLILGILLMASGCQAAPSSTGSIATIPTIADQTAASQTSLATTAESPFDTVRDGIRFETTLDRDVYKSGDIITINTRVTNTTSQSIPIWANTSTYGATGSLKIGIYVDGVANAPLISADEPSMHDALIYHGELAAGTSIERTARFTTAYHQDGETIAEVGTGTQQAVITFCRVSTDDEPIQISVPVRIENKSQTINAVVDESNTRYFSYQLCKTRVLYSYDSLDQVASNIVEGKCLSARPIFQNEMLYTISEIEITRVFKGSLAIGDVKKVVELGGRTTYGEYIKGCNIEQKAFETGFEHVSDAKSIVMGWDGYFPLKGEEQVLLFIDDTKGFIKSITEPVYGIWGDYDGKFYKQDNGSFSRPLRASTDKLVFGEGSLTISQDDLLKSP